jgi:hypothetical protein
MSLIHNPAAAGNIFLLARGLEIIKYTLENIFIYAFIDIRRVFHLRQRFINSNKYAQID